MTPKQTLLALAEQCEGADAPDNYLDVRIEVALFKPDTCYTDVRANAAGTKVIYTDRMGKEVTHWAPDWTMRPKATASCLKAMAMEMNDAAG